MSGFEDVQELRRLLRDTLRDASDEEARSLIRSGNPTAMQRYLGLVRVTVHVIPDDISNYGDER